MTDARPPLLLRPIHGWFHLWGRIVMSAYRVAAVASAAAITALLVVVVLRVHWLVAVVLATSVWILLAIIQEHDDRVRLDVDRDFLSALRAHVDILMEAAGFVFRSASGPQRSRRERYDTFLYEAPGAGKLECIDIWLHRDRSAGGRMRVTVDGKALQRLLAARGETALAERVSFTADALGDAAALADAFAVALQQR